MGSTQTGRTLACGDDDETLDARPGGLPFSRAWFESFDLGQVPAPIPGIESESFSLQLVCNDADRVQPWFVVVERGRLTDLRPGVVVGQPLAVTHSSRAALGLMGDPVSDLALGEIAVEAYDGRRWSRSAVPPLDESLGPVPEPSRSGLGWSELVSGSPLGDLFAHRVLVADSLLTLEVSRVPRPHRAQVQSSISWARLLECRSASDAWSPRHRAHWIGSSERISRLFRFLDDYRAPEAGRLAQIERDRELLRGVQVLAHLPLAEPSR